MIVPDANLLIYSYDNRAPQHNEARRWWENALSEDEPVGIPWIVILAFTRLITHPTICADPLTPRQVHGIVRHWLEQPHVRVLSPNPQTLERFFALLNSAGMGGNLSTDALVAAHAVENDAPVCSNDRDFERFPGLRRRNPLS
jgi:toxin-antitoxin system PIN domain toxin